MSTIQKCDMIKDINQSNIKAMRHTSKSICYKPVVVFGLPFANQAG